MRFAAFAGSLPVAFFLSACGGSGTTGSISSTPTPIATPTPTPVATSSGGPTGGNATLTNLQVSESFGGVGAVNRFTAAASTGATSNRQPMSTGPVQIRYDAASGSYTIATGTLPDVTFATSDRSSSGSTAVISAYGKSSGSKTDNLALFNPGPGNTQLALTYASYGGWQSTSAAGASSEVATTFFVYGIKTAPGDLPTAGTASYKTTLDGLFAGNSGLYTLSGSSAILADFAAGTIDFSMSPRGRNIVDGSVKDFGDLLGSGTIGSGTSAFAGTSDAASVNGYSATMSGQFFGPQAAEVGVAFQLTGADGQGSGVIVGKKN
ncbi:MAG TPA: transferrin-binding protein-like solute binding protein [Sphingobium sp.]